MPAITEILGRSTQGVTEPFWCRADDGHVYCVKGVNATRRGLCAELIAAVLGRDFLGLPIPDFQLLTVPHGLVRYSAVAGVQDLDIGVVFGSRKIDATMEFGPGNRHHVAPELAARILTFDFWVRNDDRRMDETGGNSNLLWDPLHRRLWVFDHNLAFEDGVDDAALVQRHAFGATATVKDALTESLRAELAERMGAGLDTWSDITARVPPEWLYQDGERAVPVDFGLQEFREMLVRIASAPDVLWRTLT